MKTLQEFVGPGFGSNQKSALLRDLCQAAQSGGDSTAGTRFQITRNEDGSIELYPKLDECAINRSRMMCDFLAAVESSEFTFTVPFEPRHIFAWHEFDFKSTDVFTLSKVVAVRACWHDQHRADCLMQFLCCHT